MWLSCIEHTCASANTSCGRKFQKKYNPNEKLYIYIWGDIVLGAAEKCSCFCQREWGRKWVWKKTIWWWGSWLSATPLVCFMYVHAKHWWGLWGNNVTIDSKACPSGMFWKVPKQRRKRLISCVTVTSGSIFHQSSHPISKQQGRYWTDKDSHSITAPNVSFPFRRWDNSVQFFPLLSPKKS